MREFYIQTPLGKLKVYSKHETDNSEDYPGVYIDLVRDGYDDDMLCCVEYDSWHEHLQTCLYQPGNDNPVSVVVHATE